MAGTKADFPERIFKAYSERMLTRAGFVRALSDWQKLRGLNYDCKGTFERGALCLTYRGQKAVIRGGRVVWARGEWRDPESGKSGFCRHTADSVFEFCRKVDFAILSERTAEGGSLCAES